VPWPPGASRGLLRSWNGSIGRFHNDRIEPEDDKRERFAGVPGMGAVGKHLAADLTVRTGVRVAPPQRLDSGLRLRSDTGETLGDFDLPSVAVPAPQAETLLGPGAPDLAARAESVRYSPAWALMLAFETDPGLPYDGLFFDGGEIGWAARNSSKPSRSGNTWIVHAAPAWTHARCDEPGEEIAAALGNLLASRAGIDATDLVVQTARPPLALLVGRQSTRDRRALGSLASTRRTRRLVPGRPHRRGLPERAGRRRPDTRPFGRRQQKRVRIGAHCTRRRNSIVVTRDTKNRHHQAGSKRPHRG
jgi:hypothetical protein